MIAATDGTNQCRRRTSYPPSLKPLMSSAGCWTHHSLRMLSCTMGREASQFSGGLYCLRVSRVNCRKRVS